MSSTPEVRAIVLRDDLPTPAGFDAPQADGTTLLVAVPHDAPDDLPVAAVLLRGNGPVLRLDHLWVRPDLRRRGLGRAVLELARGRSSAQGATVLSAEVRADDPGTTALAAGTRVLGEYLVKPLGAEPEPGVLGYRNLTPEEFGPWQDAQVRAYAEDNLPRSGGDLELALERSRADFERLLPEGLDTPSTSLVALTADGERVGHLWLAHHVEPGLSFVYDVEVDEHQRGRGFGRAAMDVAEVLALAAGDDRIGLHVFGGNTAARNLYRTHGYLVESTTHDLLARDVP